MSGAAVQYPVDVITIRLDSGRLARVPANDDVAYALVSRFNVRMHLERHPRWSHLERRNLADSPDYERFWLHRLDLFERVCIPSVVNLTPRPDAWFVAFGDVESWFVRELLDRLRPYPWIRPYFREHRHPDDAGPLPDMLRNFTQTLGKSYLCSTRFDSDDSLHQQFVRGLDLSISQLRKRDSPPEPCCLNFLYGLMESDEDLSVFLRRNNMFQSVFEPVDQIGGPYAVGHDEVRGHMPLYEIVTNLPMWLYRRHEETLEPGWVTKQEHVSLADAGNYYPSFGLKPGGPDDSRTTQDDAAAERILTNVADRNGLAAELRASAYWDAAQVERAVELATAGKQPTLALWLDPRQIDSVDLVRVVQEIEGIEGCFLNGARLARLARELDADGESSLALRLFDYAVFVAPHDRHLRRERDALAGDMASILDFDEQMDILDVAPPSEVHSNAVVFVVSCLFGTEAGAALAQAEYLAGAGFSVTVMLVLGAGQNAPDLPEGLTVEVLRVKKPDQSGRPAPHRQALRLLARRVSEMGPSLLVADDTSGSQRLVAAVGRALGIPVEFARSPGELVNSTPASTP